MMKKTLLLALCLSATFLGGWSGANTASAKTASMSTANDDEQGGNKKDVTAGDDTNSATFSWSGTTLTVTGKGDLSKITVTDNDTKVFSATGAGKVYTKSGETSTAVKQGDSYDSNAKYYEPTITYGEAMTPSTQWNANYSMSSAFTLTLGTDESMHAIYWGDNGATAYVTVTSSDAQAIQNSNNWEKLDNDTKYAYWCVFKGTYSGTETSITLQQSSFTNGVYTGDGYTITLLNASNRGNYGGTKSTIKASADNLYYSSDATNYTWLAKDASVEYTDGMLLYTATSTVKEEAIENNEEYFFTTHADYLTGAVMSFAEYLPHAVGSTYSTVIFKTDANVVTTENSQKANINNEITRALVKCAAIETLNLQDTYLAELKNVDNSKETDPTFYTGSKPGQWEQSVADNTTLTTLYMPCTGTETLKGSGSDNETNRLTVFHYLVALKSLHLGEGIKTLGDHAISETGTFMSLETLTFPNSLEKAEADCMNGQTKVLTLSFPKGMKTIERHAFWGTNPKDVYFLGTKAPTVAAFAWGENNYISNNAMTNDTIVGDTPETSIRIQKANGVAVRQNYETRNGWYAMLHYPAACTEAEAARYTDLTRSYKKIVYGVENETFKKKMTVDGQGIECYYYEAGKESETLYGKGADNDAGILGNVEASTFFQNIYPDGSYGGNYDGGYEDYYVGSQYIWPSMGQSQRACIVAENGVLWDGVTTIGAGISKYDSEYTNNGSEYIGLHQFVFAQGDVTTDKTDEWDVTKYADGKWHSICLPFHVTKAKMKETFGANEKGEYNFRVCKFHKVDRTDEKLKLYFNNEFFENAEDNDTVLTAHVSYMIKAKKENMVDGEKVVLKNYVLEAGSPVPTNVTANAKSSGSEGETEANQYYFIGQYNSGITIPQYSYFFSKTYAKFRFQASDKAKWNGYTSVVEAPNGKDDYQKYFNGNTDSDAKLATIWDEDETTGIDNVTIIAGDEIIYTSDNVYNLSGQLVSTKGMNGLAKGIYIQNGKKYIVK